MLFCVLVGCCAVALSHSNNFHDGVKYNNFTTFSRCMYEGSYLDEFHALGQDSPLLENRAVQCVFGPQIGMNPILLLGLPDLEY